MLVNCPRCGFQQPQDRYCAQCGVDMEMYRAPQPSLSKKIFGNPVLQVGGVLAIAAVVGVSVYQRQRYDLEDRVNYLKNGPQIARSVSSPVSEETPAEEPPLAETPPAEVSAFAAPAASSPETTQAAPSTAIPEAATKAVDAKNPDTKDVKTGKAGPPKQGEMVVRVFFAEVATPALDQIFEESAASGQFNRMGDFIAGIVPDLGKKISPSNTDIKILSRQQKPIEPGRPVVFSQGVHAGEPESEAGLSFYIELTETDGTSYRGNIEVVRAWRESAGPGTPSMPTKKTFPAVFELGQSSGFFMSGLLPRRSALENSDDLTAVAPFQILRSNAFRAGASEAVLFIEFDRN